jgi:hypothetical protein
VPQEDDPLDMQVEKDVFQVWVQRILIVIIIRRDNILQWLMSHHKQRKPVFGNKNNYKSKWSKKKYFGILNDNAGLRHIDNAEDILWQMSSFIVPIGQNSEEKI